MKEVLKAHHISFKNAFTGLFWAIRTQPNFRVHLFFSVCALTLGFFLGISSVEMTIVAFTIVLGLTTEMMNTAVESMTDLITTEWRQEAKIAKDVSAGMMLVAAVGAVVVAGLIFTPHLIKFFHL